MRQVIRQNGTKRNTRKFVPEIKCDRKGLEKLVTKYTRTNFSKTGQDGNGEVEEQKMNIH